MPGLSSTVPPIPTHTSNARPRRPLRPYRPPPVPGVPRRPRRSHRTRGTGPPGQCSHRCQHQGRAQCPPQETHRSPAAVRPERVRWVFSIFLFLAGILLTMGRQVNDTQTWVHLLQSRFVVGFAEAVMCRIPATVHADSVPRRTHSLAGGHPA